MQMKLVTITSQKITKGMCKQLAITSLHVPTNACICLHLLQIYSLASPYSYLASLRMIHSEYQCLLFMFALISYIT